MWDLQTLHDVTWPKNWLHAEWLEYMWEWWVIACLNRSDNATNYIQLRSFVAPASFCKAASCSVWSDMIRLVQCKVAAYLLRCGQLTHLFSRSFLLFWTIGSLLDFLVFGVLNPSFQHKQARRRSHDGHPHCQNALDVSVTSHGAIQHLKIAILSVVLLQYLAEHDASHSRYDEANEAHRPNGAPNGLGPKALDLIAYTNRGDNETQNTQHNHDVPNALNRYQLLWQLFQFFRCLSRCWCLTDEILLIIFSIELWQHLALAAAGCPQNPHGPEESSKQSLHHFPSSLLLLWLCSDGCSHRRKPGWIRHGCLQANRGDKKGPLTR